VILEITNSEHLGIDSRTGLTSGLSSEWNRAEIPTSQPFSSEHGFQTMHATARALMSPNGTLFEGVVSPQPIFSSESNFVASNGWLNGGGGWLNGGGMLIGTDGVFCPKLDSVNLYVSQVERQLVSLQSDLLNLYTVPDYFSYWPDEFESLYS